MENSQLESAINGINEKAAQINENAVEVKAAKEKTGNGKPICILMHTVMGNGVDFMMHTHALHGKAPND